MKIKGLYGEELSVSEWAERLGVTPELVHICLHAGKSVADIHAMLGKPYTPPKTRKPREGAQMAQTKERMAILLEASGIADRGEAIKELTVERIGTHSWHGVYYRGALLGAYDYKNGNLRLSGGQGLPLWSLEWDDAKVVRGSDDLWNPHPSTHALIVKNVVKTDDDLAEGYEANRQTAELRRSTRQTYDGFGKQYTCAEWERVLGVSRSTLWRALQRGESIEDFAKRKGIKVK